MKCSNCGKDIPEDTRLPLQAKGYLHETDTVENLRDGTVWWHASDEQASDKQVECPHCNEYVDVE